MEINTDELKQAAPIIEYVETHYSNKIKIVEKSLSMAKAFCIWHNETDSPSLTFFRNGTYKCFGECGANGDVITLVMKMENVTFQEACKIIGDNVGIEIVITPLNPYHEAYKDAMDNNSRRYWYNFQLNNLAKNYMMVTRALTKETLDTFRIGMTDINEYKFRNDIGGISARISFPILENKIHNPKCIGMGYRTLRDEKPKYINDCNQEGRQNQNPNVAGIFVKGNVLYGYPMAYKHIKENQFAILVEGYIDVVSLHQAGLKNVLSAMGTAITEAQADIIKKITNNVMLILDADKAGMNAMAKALPMLLSKGLNVAICTLDKGTDPAYLCVKHNFNTAKIYDVIKQNTVQAGLFLINNAVSAYENIVVKERQRALEIALPTLNNMTNEVEKQIYMDMLYQRIDLRR